MSAFWIPPANRCDLVRLRYLCRITTGDGDTQDAADDGPFPFFIRSKRVLTSDRYFYDGEGILIPGEGQVGEIFHHHVGPMAVHQRVYLLYGFDRVFPRYVFHVMEGTFRFMVDQGTAKSTVDVYTAMRIQNQERLSKKATTTP